MTQKKKKAPPFVMVRRDLLNDPAWRTLSNSAKVVYIYMRSKYHPQNPGEVILTYSDLKDTMSSSTLSRAFKDLIKAGFIEKTKKGGLYGGACMYKFIGIYKDFY